MNKKNLNNYSTTVLFTDIVGYSSLFSKNEQKAMNLLKKHDEVIVPIIDENDGKIIKNIGDSFFVKYEDSINAIKSALEIQKQIFARNEIKNEKDQFKIRIGIHSGEIIEKNNDLFGNVVNIASRIEGICIEGGVAVSDDVFKQVNSEVKLHAIDMGFALVSESHKLSFIIK